MSKDPKSGETYRQLVDTIYAGALDPERYVEMMRAWDAHYKELHDQDPETYGAQFDWTQEFVEHFERAGEIFERISPTDRVSLEDRAKAMPSAALIADTSGRVRFANPLAVSSLGEVEGAHLTDLAYDQPSLDGLADLVRALQGGSFDADAERRVLRLTPEEEGDPLICVVDVFEDPANQSRALFLRSANTHWHEAVEQTLRASFGLTKAETELVKRLQLGATVNDISEETGRSKATLRTQLGSTLNKMGVKSQAALARAVAGLVTVLSRDDLAGARMPRGSPAHGMAQQRMRTLDLGGGQMVQVAESGDLSGWPFYFVQTTTWPTLTPQIVEALASHGIRLISAFRPGLGESTAHKAESKLPALIAPHQKVMDALGLDRVMLGGHTSGSVYALALAQAQPERFEGLALVDAGAPLRNAWMINQMPLAPRRLFLAARFFPMALRTPYKLVATDFYSGAEGEARGVNYFVEDAPHDTVSVEDPTYWQIVRDNVDYCLRNREQAIKDVCLWSYDHTALTLEVMSQLQVSYIQGRENLVHAADRLEGWVKDKPNAHAQIIENEGQLAIYRRPDAFAQALVVARERSFAGSAAPASSM